MDKKDILLLSMGGIIIFLLAPGILGGLFKITWWIFQFVAVAVALLFVIMFVIRKMKK